MFSYTRPSDFVRRSLALTAILSASVAVAGAQTPTSQPDGFTSATPALNLQAPAMDTSKDALFSSSSSSADGDFLASNAAPATFENAMQYGGGGGGRYGRPRYRGGNTNQDGSSKYTFYAGAGVTIPVQTTNNTNTASWGLQVGAGRNFNRHLGVNLEFGYDNFGLTGSSISDYIYVNTGSPVNSYGLDANMHVWNFSLQPIYTIYSGEGLGAYITGGVGFYHKVTNFTLPQEVGDEFGDVFEENQVIDHYTSNAIGADGGIGLTYKFSRFSNERLYAEARYVYMANQFKPGANDGNYLNYTGNNLYPANSNTTTFFPVKFGIRF